MKCSKCESHNTKKKGERATYQLYYCNDCHKNFKIPKKERKNILKEIKHFISNSDEKYLWLIFSFFSAIYFLTYINANMYLLADAYHDDALFFWLGNNIFEGEWLGKYNQFTLAKMPSYAMFIAFIMKTGIPYLWVISILNIIAVAFLIIKSKYLFGRAKWLLFILGILLLFNPLLATELRIYRNQLPAIFFIIFTTTLISLFNPSTKKTHFAVKIIEALIIAVAWGLLWFSREENLFYIGCLVLALISFLLVIKFTLFPWRNLYPLIYGISGIIIFWLFISGMNYKHYGRFVVCEKTSSPYTDVIKTFNSIYDPNFPENISGSAASREKILMVGEAVPFFRPMANNLITSAINYRGVYFDNETLGFIKEDPKALTISHFEWAWIAAAAATGYYKDAPTLAAFYTELDKELNRAISEKRLETKKNTLINVGPYSLTNEDIKIIVQFLPKAYIKLISSPAKFSSWHKNILSKRSIVVNEKTMKFWKKKLKINYIEKGDKEAYKESHNSFSSKVWYIIVIIWAYSAIPLMHISTLLAFIAIIYSLFRKKWVFAALIITISSMFIAHYLMLTTVSVISSFDAVRHGYFLLSYGTMLITAFLSVSVIFNLQRAVK